MPRPGAENVQATKAAIRRADKQLDALEAAKPTATEHKPLDVLAEFKKFCLRHLDPMPINERTTMARRWVAHINLAFLPERLTPAADLAQEAVDAGEVPHVH